MPDPVTLPIVPPVVPPVVPPAGTPWHQGVLTPEDLGHAQLKGWDLTDPIKFGTAAHKAYREAERHIGTPPDQLVRLPKDASDEAGLKAFRARIGVPDAPTGYDLTGVKFSDGTDLDEGFATAMKSALHASGIPKDAATGVLNAFVKHLENATTAEVAEQTANVAQERAKLAANWGANHALNLEIAKRGAMALGMTPEQVSALESQLGYAGTMEAMLKVGMISGEAKFVTPNTPSGQRIMSKDMAVARVQELKRDTEWAKRYMNGDAEAKREMVALNQIISGQTLTDADLARNR